MPHAVARCAQCQASLAEIGAVGYEERQGFEIPAIRIAVPAHRAAIQVCPACGRASKGTCPASVPPAVQYGPMVTTGAAYFTHQHQMAVERTTEICADLVQHRGSEATVVTASEPLERGIAPATAAVQGMLREAEVLHVDAAGLQVSGKLHWLQVASPERLTSYAVHAKRGHEAMEDAGILGAFTGTAVPDHWQPSVTDDEGNHALCNAPHLRARRCIEQQYRQPWAKEMTDLLREITAAVDATPWPAMS